MNQAVFNLLHNVPNNGSQAYMISKNVARLVGCLALVAMLGGAIVLTGFATAGFTATVKNASNVYGTGTQFVSVLDTNNTPLCSSVPTGSVVPAANTFLCDSSPWAAQVPASGNTSFGLYYVPTGTAAPAPMTLQTSCAPIQLANRSDGANPLLPRGNLTYSPTGGPSTLPGSGAVNVNDSTSYAVSVANPVSSPGTFTEAIWFKTTVAGGGMLGSADDSNIGNNASAYDRMLYLDSAGNVVFGIFINATVILRSSGASLANGAWHFALASVSYDGSSTTSRLYVDGAQVASNITSGQAQSYNLFWRIGNTKNTTADGWSGVNRAFTGQLSNASISWTAITPAQVSYLYTKWSQSSYNIEISAYGPVNHWPLNDSGTQTFAGPYPDLGTTSPCAGVSVMIGTPTQCIYPSSPSSCSGTFGSMTALTAAGQIPMQLATVDTAQSVRFWVARNGSYVTYNTGLQLLLTTILSQVAFSQKFVWLNKQMIE